MLRIAPSPAGPSTPPTDPTAPPMPPPTMLPMATDSKSGGMGKYDAEKVKPEVARYLTPDQGPFECQNCHHFDGQGGCEIVSGPIDPEGVCCLFESAGGGSDDDQDQTDQSGGGADQAPPIAPTNPLG